MDRIHAYILAVAAASIFCAVICSFAGKNSPVAALVKLMTGVVMAGVIIRPIAEWSMVDLGQYLDALNTDAAAAVEAGTSAAREETRSRITLSLESYILDKAAQLSVDIDVELTLEEDSMIPVAVVLKGAASPYSKSQLEILLREELGIPGENITWK